MNAETGNNVHEESDDDEDEYDDEDDPDEYFNNKKLNIKLHELTIQLQKFKYSIEDQIKGFRTELVSSQEKQSSALKEFDSYIQNMHTEVSKLIDVRQKDKAELSAEISLALSRADEVF